MSATGWKEAEAAALQLVHRLAAEGEGGTALVDRDAVLREARATQDAERANAPGGAPVHCICFGDWIKTGHADGGVLDEHAIRAAAASVATDHIVVVDAHSHRRELVLASFRHLRYGWFPLDQWHPAFVLVLDDADLLEVADTLSGTFYSEPKLMSEVEVNRILRHLQRQAALLRWVGPKFQKWQKSLPGRVINAWSARVERRHNRLETDR